ncbi:DUF1989 domain-containing protein [Sphingopyxis panaciterrae]
MTTVLAPRSGVAFRLSRDQILRVIDPEGTQVSDLLAFSASDVREAISNGQTFAYEETIQLTTGSPLWSNRSNPMLEIVEDSAGTDDSLFTPCSEATFRHLYADKPVHCGCFGNLAEALAPFGIEADAIPVAFNIFMNVRVGPDGRIKLLAPPTAPGDFIRLRALDDLIIGLTACSVYDSCSGSFKPIHYETER